MNRRPPLPDIRPGLRSRLLQLLAFPECGLSDKIEILLRRKAKRYRSSGLRLSAPPPSPRNCEDRQRQNGVRISYRSEEMPVSKNPGPQLVNLNTDGQIDSTGTARVHQSCASFSYDFIWQKVGQWGFTGRGMEFQFRGSGRDRGVATVASRVRQRGWPETGPNPL